MKSFWIYNTVEAALCDPRPRKTNEKTGFYVVKISNLL